MIMHGVPLTLHPGTDTRPPGKALAGSHFEKNSREKREKQWEFKLLKK